MLSEQICGIRDNSFKLVSFSYCKMKLIQCANILLLTLLVVICYNALIVDAVSEEDGEFPTDEGYIDFKPSDSDASESDVSESDVSDVEGDGASSNETSADDESDDVVYDENGILMTSDHSFKWESLF